MTENPKRDVAVFRFGVICDFVNGPKLDHGQKEALIKEKCARKWSIPNSNKTRISRSTILRWIKLYEKGYCPNSPLDFKLYNNNSILW